MMKHNYSLGAQPLRTSAARRVADWRERVVTTYQAARDQEIDTMRWVLAQRLRTLIGRAVALESLSVDPAARTATVVVDGVLFRGRREYVALVRPCVYCGSGAFESQPLREPVDVGYALSAWLPAHPNCQAEDSPYWLEGMLERTDDTDRSAARGKALLGAGRLAWAEGDFQAASLLAEESLSIMREIGDKRASGYAEGLLGLVRMGQRNSAVARPLLEASRSLFQELGDVWGEASTLYALGMATYLSGEGAAARAYYEESLRLYRQVGDMFGVTLLASALEAVGLVPGEEETAPSLYEQSLPLLRASKDRGRLGMVLINTGDSWLHHYGDAHLGKMHYKQGLKLWQDMQRVDDGRGLVRGLAGLAEVAAGEGQAERAGRLFGAAAHLLVASNSEREELNRRSAAARARLDAGPFEAGWAAGEAMTAEQAITEVLQDA